MAGAEGGGQCPGLIERGVVGYGFNMLRRLLACFCLAAMLAARPAEAEVRRIERNFPGGPNVALQIDSYRGLIEISVAPDSQFHLELVLDPGTEDKAKSDRLLQEVETQISQDGPVVTIRLRNPSVTGLHLELNEPQRVTVEIRCQVPRSCRLDLATNDGSINVGDLSGNVKVRARNGTLFFRHINGDIDAADDHGDIVLSHCTGSVKMSAVVGNIRAGTIVGPVDLQTTNGDIEVQHVLGGGKLSATAGDITLGLPKVMTRDVSADTDGGAITVRLDPEAHCTLHASSVWGKIHLRPAVPVLVQSGGDRKRTLVGTLNGGGPDVRLHASGGQIQINALVL
jgi:hypothetical protein